MYCRVLGSYSFTNFPLGRDVGFSDKSIRECPQPWRFDLSLNRFPVNMHPSSCSKKGAPPDACRRHAEGLKGGGQRLLVAGSGRRDLPACAGLAGQQQIAGDGTFRHIVKH